MQSASRGECRSDVQEVHVEVPCDLHVEECYAQDIDALPASGYMLPQTKRGERLLYDQYWQRKRKRSGKDLEQPC